VFDGAAKWPVWRRKIQAPQHLTPSGTAHRAKIGNVVLAMQYRRCSIAARDACATIYGIEPRNRQKPFCLNSRARRSWLYFTSGLADRARLPNIL